MSFFPFFTMNEVDEIRVYRDLLYLAWTEDDGNEVAMATSLAVELGEISEEMAEKVQDVFFFRELYPPAV